MSEGTTKWGPLAIGGVVVAILVIVCAGVVLVLGGRGEDPGSSSGDEAPEVTLAADADPEAAITEVISSISAGEPDGIDPDTWDHYSSLGAAIPEGSTLSVVDESVIVDGELATADAVLTMADGVTEDYWVFLRHDEEVGWLVTSTMKLELDR